MGKFYNYGLTGYHIYRFLDSQDNTIYVGRTVNLEERLYYHDKFTKDVAKIVYINCDSSADMMWKEIYYINYYRNPKMLNSSSRGKSGEITDLHIEEEWKELDIEKFLKFTVPHNIKENTHPMIKYNFYHQKLLINKYKLLSIQDITKYEYDKENQSLVTTLKKGISLAEEEIEEIKKENELYIIEINKIKNTLESTFLSYVTSLEKEIEWWIDSSIKLLKETEEKIHKLDEEMKDSILKHKKYIKDNNIKKLQEMRSYRSDSYKQFIKNRDQIKILEKEMKSMLDEHKNFKHNLYSSYHHYNR